MTALRWSNQVFARRAHWVTTQARKHDLGNMATEFTDFVIRQLIIIVYSSLDVLIRQKKISPPKQRIPRRLLLNYEIEILRNLFSLNLNLVVERAYATKPFRLGVNCTTNSFLLNWKKGHHTVGQLSQKLSSLSINSRISFSKAVILCLRKNGCIHEFPGGFVPTVVSYRRSFRTQSFGPPLGRFSSS